MIKAGVGTEDDDYDIYAMEANAELRNRRSLPGADGLSVVEFPNADALRKRRSLPDTVAPDLLNVEVNQK